MSTPVACDTNSNVVEMYQFSDNFFYVRIMDTYGQYESATLYPQAQYLISDRRGNTKVLLSIGSGISVVDVEGENLFLIHIDDAKINFKGTFIDQFTTWDSNGHKQPPRFIRKIKVNKVVLNG